MKKITFGYDYSAVGDRCYIEYVCDDELENRLTYSEMCERMYRLLEQLIDNGYISKEEAFDMVGDYHAFNEFMDSAFDEE